MRAAIIASCGVTLAIGIAGSNAEGCGWSGYERSIRFSTGYTVADRLPPLPLTAEMSFPSDDGSSFWGYYEEDSEGCGCGGEYASEAAYERFERFRTVESDVRTRIASGDIRGAQSRLEDLLRQTAGFDRDAELGEELHEEVQEIRNRAIDMLDMVREHQGGVSVAAIQTYAELRWLDLDKDLSTDRWFRLAAFGSREPRFADNVAYLNGAYLYHHDRFSDAAEAFDDLVERWPDSDKRAAATYMAGVAWIRAAAESRAENAYFQASSCIEKAASRLETAERRYSGSVYSEDIIGWLAHVNVAVHELPDALVVYYTRLADPSDRYAQLEAARSLNLVRRRADDDDMLEVERRLESRPDVALVYAYHEIYNEEALLDPDDWPYSEVLASDRRAQLERIVAFCSRMSSRWPAGSFGAGFALRVAGASLELKRNEDAARFAQRAVSAAPGGLEKSRSLYLLATAQLRLARHAEARATTAKLLAAGPDERMEERANRLLARAFEDAGDLAGALDVYRRIGYDADAAYVIDTLMTVGQIETYVQARPNDPDVDWLRYAVGVRLLRAGLYERAERAFEKVRTTSDFADSLVRDRYSYGMPDEDGPVVIKQSYGADSRVKTPRQQWVARDMQAARDLRELELFANRPSDSERSAEAKYQFAAYLFDNEALLFYNPSLWWGNRADLLNSIDGSSAFRLPGEEARLWAETNAHEALAQSVDHFLDVVDRYPDSKAAPDALYSAAVAHERLANFNGYWRSRYEEGRHAGRRLVTYDDVRRAYPAYRFPKGTFGWQASTRTVNGGPGWDPLPPKPKPESAWRRYVRRVPEVIAEFGGPVVAAVWGTVRSAASWLADLARRAAILFVKTSLLVLILVAWIAAARSSFRLAVAAAKGHVRARALLPATSSYRPREHRWLAWAAGRIGSLRDGAPRLSITKPGPEEGKSSVGPRIDDRVVVFIERARLFLCTTPEGLACTLVVVTHLPILVLMAIAM